MPCRTVAVAVLTACTLPAIAQDATHQDAAPADIEVEPDPTQPADLDAAKGPFRLLPDPWTGSIDAGLSGSTGNSENFSLRVNAGADRIIEDVAETRLSARYTYKSDNGNDTDNRFEANARHDWLFAESPWRAFARASYEYDEFQDYDHRISAGGGLGYEFIDNDTTLLVGRIGAQGTWELGRADGDRFTPEGILGIDFEHQLTERQKIYFTGDYLPALDDFWRYRVVARAGWEILIDPDANLFLKAGVENRYDSSPGPDTDRNDLDYFLTVGTTF